MATTEAKATPKSRLFDLIAESLRAASLDIVGIIHAYLLSKTASSGARPKLLPMIGSKGKKDGLFDSRVTGIACGPDGRLFIGAVETVQVFTADGKFLRHLAEGVWNSSRGLAVASTGEVFVADSLLNRVVVCGQDGSVVRRIYVDSPMGVAIDPKQGLLFATATDGDKKVQVMKLDGSFVRSFECDVWTMPTSAYGIAVSDTEVYAVVCDGHRLQVFDHNGKVLRVLAGGYSGDNGYFKYPMAVALDAAGNVIVSDSHNHRVQCLTATGAFITAFGERGQQAGQFEFPHPVCVDIEGRVLVGDASCRVQVFAFD